MKLRRKYQMSLSCGSCGQDPYPSLRTWQVQINNSKSTNGPNIYITDSSSFLVIANHLEKYVKQLQTELIKATNALHSARELSAPITKLSDDILRFIFEEMTLPGCEVDSNLTLVCKRWRNIITSTSSFWTQITIPPISDLQFSLSIPHALETRLSRVGEFLPLTLDCPGLLVPIAQGFMKPVWNRIRSLQVEIDDVDAQSTINASLRLPHLEVLMLDCKDARDRIKEEECWCDDYRDHDGWYSDDAEYAFDTESGHHEECPRHDAFIMGSEPISLELPEKVFPSLKDITLRVERPLEAITLPWAQLTRLNIKIKNDYDLPFSFGPIIAQLKKIEVLELDLDFRGHLHPFNSDPHQITLLHLRSLALTGYNRHIFTFRLLHQLCSPALRTLKLKLESGFESFLATIKNPNIRDIVELELELGLGYKLSANSAEGLISSLKGFRRLESFLCNVCKTQRYADHILRALTQTHDNPPNDQLFPQLQELELTQVTLDKATYLSLREFLKVRVSRTILPPTTRKALRTVRIELHSDIDSSPSSNTKLSKQTIKPSQYNDWATSVTLQMIGSFAEGGWDGLWNKFL